MATLAGSVMASYISMLGGGNPETEAQFASYFLTASIMNAPAALVMSKILYPETEEIDTRLQVSKESLGVNIIDAIATGAADGLKLALNVGILLLTRRKMERWDWIVMIVGLVLAMAFVISVPKIFTKLKKYHQERIMVLLDEEAVDKKGGAYYNLQQSKIAIGSGGFSGKGYLEGTQTKYDFVPEQHSDFIFCTVGEEFGWVGSFLVILLFMILLFRIVIIAERQKSRFARIYGYCVASIFFAHFTFNLSMTVGLFPTIGVPLPFMSYGGSSLWSFTLMLFILLKLDMHRNRLFGRD